MFPWQHGFHRNGPAKDAISGEQKKKCHSLLLQSTNTPMQSHNICAFKSPAALQTHTRQIVSHGKDLIAPRGAKEPRYVLGGHPTCWKQCFKGMLAL